MMPRRISVFLWGTLFVLISVANSTPTSDESSQIQKTPPNLSTEELSHLLSLLDSDDDHPLLNLGDLLLEDDDMNNSLPTPPPTRPTTPKSTTATTTTTTPPTSTQEIQRRQDYSQIESVLQRPAQPSHEELVSQLSLFNSLLQSLSTNATTTTTPGTTTGAPGPPQMTQEQMQLLAQLFGGGVMIPQSTTDSSLLKRQTTSAPNAAQAQAADLNALSDLLKTLAVQGALAKQTGGNGVHLDHLKNFQNNNMDMTTASTNQISGILSLLGTLGSLGAFAQPQQNSLFNFGQPQQQQNAGLLGFLNPQPAQSQQTPNIFGNLFAQQSQPQPQQYSSGGGGLTSLIAPGLGSIFSTMTNILGGSGYGGKPRVRGKGVDTRVGLGYRLGDAADAQLMFDIGPQIFTDTIQNEHRQGNFKHKRQDQQSLQAQAQLEKQQQQQMVSRRHMQVAAASRRQYQVQPPPQHILEEHKRQAMMAEEAALKKELIQIAEMQRRLDLLQQQRHLQGAGQQGLSPADIYQMTRDKQVIKRASDSPLKEDKAMEASPSVQIQRIHSFKRFPAPPPQRLVKKSSRPPMMRRNPPPPPHPGFLNLGIFGRYRGQPVINKRQPGKPSHGDNSVSGGEMMSRWDMSHRFDNFKNTNGELVMTDTNSKDRFYARNKEPTNNGNVKADPNAGA